MALSNRDKILSIEASLNEFYLERKEVIRSISVGLLSNLNVILVGPPGTAKTDISCAYNSHISGAKYFGTTLHSYSSPDEVFGAVDIHRYRETGILSRRTEGYLPNAHIVAIEEIFKAGKGMLNSLIEVSHPSRLFSNGPEQVKTPILSIIGTSNELPIGEEALAAIYDRMNIKMYVKRLTENVNFEKMILANRKYSVENKTTISLKELMRAREEVSAVKLEEGVLKRLTVLREELLKAGITPSDRTFKVSIGALQAHAYLEGRSAIDDNDLMFLRYMLWYDPTEEAGVARVIINMVKPELKRLNEIKEAVDKAVVEILDSNNLNDAAISHKSIRNYIQEAKNIRAQMVKKGRGIDECDEIIRSLKGHAATLSKKLMGISLDDDNKDGDFF